MSLLTNIVAYWKFSESSGDAADATGNGWTLTNNNSATYGAGLIGNCVIFGTSNTNKYLSNANNLGITGGAMSIAMWVNPQTAPSATTYALATQSDVTTSDTFFSIYYEDAGGLRVRFQRTKVGVAANNFSHSVDLGTGSWHQLVLTYNGSTVTGYLDGSSVGTVASSGNGSGGTNFNAFELARNNPDGGEYASVKEDEVGVWSRELTSAEVTSLYNGGAGLQYPFSTTNTGAGFL